MQVQKPKESRFLVENSIPFSPELAAKVGVCGALILQQIHYWASCNLHVKDGHSWVYKTYENLVSDIRLYDVSTVKRALSRLKESKVLVVGKRMNKAGYDKTNWYRVDKDVLKALLKPVALIGSKCTNPLGQNDPIHKVKKNQPIPKTTAKTTDIDYLQLASEIAGKIQLENSGEIKQIEEGIDKIEKTEENEMANASDVLKAFDKSPAISGTGVQALALLWRKRVASEYGGFQKPLTLKEIGQLKHVLKALGSDALPVLDHTLQHWSAFASEASVQAGVIPPMAPVTGFFCSHWNIAANLRLKYNKVESQVPVLQAGVQSIAEPKQKLGDNTGHEQHTPAEVQATLEALAAIVASNPNT